MLHKYLEAQHKNTKKQDFTFHSEIIAQLICYNKRMKRQYFDLHGIEVPSVTTVLAQLNKPQLVPWAAKLAKQGINWEQVRNDAAEIGTVAHTMVENFIKNQPSDFTRHPHYQKALKAFSAFQYWVSMNDVKFLGSEIPLVHHKKRFGGTIDIIALVNGKVTLIDLKTSNSLSEEYNYQVSAYQFLLEQADLDDTGATRKFPIYKIDQAILLRIDKNYGIFEERTIMDFTKYHQIFFLLLDLWFCRDGN